MQSPLSAALVQEGFESSGGFEVGTSLDDYESWTVVTGNATIITDQAHSRSQSVEIAVPTEGVTELERTLPSADSTSLYTDFWLRPVVPEGTTESTVTLDGAFLGFSRGTGEDQAQVFVFDGDPATGSGTWQATGITFAVDPANGEAQSWHRLTFLHDYSSQQWSLAVDGAPAAEGLGFDREVTAPSKFILFGSALAKATWIPSR